MPTPKFVVIDGNAIVHRAYHAIPPLTTKNGVVVNAVYGFISMLLKMLNDLKPEYVAVTFDLAGATFRHKQFEKYKATRVKADQALYDQIPLVKKVVEAFGLPIYCKEGYEADDVIGTIVAKEHDEPMEIFVVTGDMDTLQLVNGKVKVYTLRKGLTDVIVYDEEKVKERFGILPKQLVDYKAIRGDVSDNIPGVPGIGEKGASELIQKLENIENIYGNLPELKKFGIKDSVIKKLEAGKESAYLSKTLSKIDCNVPDLDFQLEKSRVKPFDREKIVKLFQEFEFISLLKRIPQFNEGAEENKEKSAPKKIKKLDFKYKEINKATETEEVVEKIKQEKTYSLRILVEGEDLFNQKISGVIVAVDGVVYFTDDKILKKLSPIFEDDSIELLAHDLKQLLKILILQNINVKNELFDLMIASYILNPGSRAHDVPSLVLKVLGKELTASSGQESLFGIDKRQVAYETFLVLQMAEILKKDLSKNDEQKLLKKIEMPLLPVLAEMEINGVAIDIVALKELEQKVDTQIKEVSEFIFKQAGVEFNISSPVQLREVLFEKMEIPTNGIKKGKTGLSTSAEELEKLRGLHPIIDAISSYRELTKLKNTYIDTLPNLVNKKTGRIHSTFNQAITATGRLSSSDPNLQNIPIRTELGREIRKSFIAKEGYKLISADYSQIELRIVASLAEDQRMIEIFNNDEDIHKATAAAIHAVPLDQVTKEMRYAAKEVNFGVLYGMGVYGLSWRADISQAEAKEFISKYFSEFRGVKNYIDRTLEFAKKEGYCETYFGRRRYIPELSSTNYQARSAAERMAINHPIQGTAADLIKLAMINIGQYLKKYSRDEVKMILQVHDELVFEVKEELVKEVEDKVKEIMEGVVELKVPIKVEAHVGQRWGDIK